MWSATRWRMLCKMMSRELWSYVFLIYPSWDPISTSKVSDVEPHLFNALLKSILYITLPDHGCLKFLLVLPDQPVGFHMIYHAKAMLSFTSMEWLINQFRPSKSNVGFFFYQWAGPVYAGEWLKFAALKLKLYMFMIIWYTGNDMNGQSFSVIQEGVFT